MNTTTLLKLAFASAACLGAIQTGFAQNIWLTPPQALVLTPSHTYQSYDTFYAGRAKMTLPEDIVQNTTSLRFDYGIAPRLALDATIGYTKVKFSPGDDSFKRSGRDDSQIGLTYALVEETAEGPALTWRVGAIIGGNYDVPTSLPPINPGDGADGFETSLAIGKSFEGGFAIYSEVGYRNRNNGVPDDLFGSVGASQRIGAFNVNVGYRTTRGQSGGDIGGPGFGTDFGFPGVKETTQFIEGGVSFTDGGGRSYQAGVAQSIGSIRNSGEATVYYVSISLPFQF